MLILITAIIMVIIFDYSNNNDHRDEDPMKDLLKKPKLLQK